MSGKDPNREALEQLWRRRLNDAKLRLEFAKNYLKEVQRDLRLGGIPTSDSNFAYKKALRAETAALAEYHRTLRIVTDLFVRGNPPQGDKPPGPGESGNVA